MDRETKEVVLPKSGEKVVVYTYITGGEDLALMRFYLKSNEELDKNVVKEKGVRATVFEETQRLAFKTIVLSIGGKKDGDALPDNKKFSVVDYVYNLRKEDFNYLVAKINEITKGDQKQEEKKTD